MYVQLNEENRILGTCDTNCFPAGTIVVEFEFPDGFDFDRQSEYLLVDGTLVESESEAARSFREEKETAEANGNFLNTAPNIMNEQDDALCALYEENLALRSRADETDDAICALYEMMIGG